MARLTQDQLEAAKTWMADAESMLPLLEGWEAQILRNVMAEWAKCSLNQDDFEILSILVRAVEHRRRQFH
jgi:hypothetical protein